jgi:hypothetical protein
MNKTELHRNFRNRRRAEGWYLVTAWLPPAVTQEFESRVAKGAELRSASDIIAEALELSRDRWNTPAKKRKGRRLAISLATQN